MMRFFSLRRPVQTGSGANPVSYLLGIGTTTPGVKLSGRETDRSPPSSAEVKNAWSYTPTTPLLLHGVVFNLARDTS
jgi:hypothetical protein